MKLRLLFFAFLSSCGSCDKHETPDASPSTPDAPLASAMPASLSLPIAGAVTSDGSVLVAGLVAAKKTIVLERHDGDRTAWSVDAITGVDWSADLEVRVLADGAGGGAVLVRSSSLKQMRTVDKDGKLGAPSTPGSAVCATEKGIGQVDGDGSIVLRAWSGAELGRVPAMGDRDPLLLCAQNDVFVLGEGEDDVMLVRVPPKGAPIKIVPDTDDERERAPFTSGDMLGVVEVTRAGAIRIVRVKDTNETRKVKKTLGEDDDLESVDGDEKVTYLALSHDGASRCSEGVATDVSMLRVGENEKEIDVVKGDCGKDLGPFRVDLISKGAVVAWAERAPKRAPTDAPVDRIAWAEIGESAKVSNASVRGEGVAFAGCAKDRCHVVVLERPAGTDGMAPGIAKIVSYP